MTKIGSTLESALQFFQTCDIRSAGSAKQLIESCGEKSLNRDFFQPGHFTSSLLTMNEDKTKVLLMHHIGLGTWQQFGGHMDGESNFLAVALKEFHEESGLDGEPTKIEGIVDIDTHFIPEREHPKHGFEPVHTHTDIIFLGLIPEVDVSSSDDDGVDGLKWLTKDEALNVVGRRLKRILLDSMK